MVAPLYLDANAGVPPLEEARRALAEAARVTGNPSSTHAHGRAARAVLDEARAHIARALGGDPREIVLTSGASEGNRWLADAASRRAAGGARAVVVASPLEHPSLEKPLAAAAGQAARLTAGLDGAGDAELVARADVLFCTAAHNETGIVPDLDLLLARAKDDCIVCVDAAQAVARMAPLPARVDAVVASAHKLGGLAGAGALLLRGNARRLAPPWTGGGQEGGLRPGTEALVLHAAFGAACAVVDETRARHRALAPLRDRIEAALVDAWGARVLGAGGRRLDNTSALVVSGADGDALRIAVDAAGVSVGFGAACSALVPEPSPSLLALGLSAADAKATVRISLPPSTTAADVDEAVARLTPVAAVIERSRARNAGR